MANNPKTGEPIPEAPLPQTLPAVPTPVPQENKELFSSTPASLNTLYDTTTGLPSKLPFTDISQAIVNGTVGYKKDAEIPVIAPDGTPGTLPGANVAIALQQGYKLEGAQAKAVREYVQDNKGISGTLKVGLGQFADEALFGAPEIVFDNTSNPLEIAKKNALKADHEIANTIGGVSGFGASMFYGGELFQAASKGGKAAQTLIRGGEALAAEAIAEKGVEAATKTLVNRLVATGATESAAKAAAPGLLRETAANMAKYGIEGAIITAPQTITESILVTGKGIANDNLSLADYAPVAEHVALGIGAGALLGIPGPLGSRFSKLSKDVLKSGIFEDVTGGIKDYLKPENLLIRGAGLDKSQAKKYGVDNLEHAARVLLDNKVLIKGENFNNLLEKVENFKSINGSEIGSIIKESDAILQASGNKKIGFDNSDVIKELHELLVKYDEPIFKSEANAIRDIIETFEKREVAEKSKLFGSLTVEQFDKNIDKGMSIDIGEGRDLNIGKDTFKVTISMEEAQKLKVAVEKSARYDHNISTGINEVKKKAADIVRDGVDSAIGRIAESTGDAKLYERFMNAKGNYKAASDMMHLIDNKEAKIGNKVFGLTDWIVGAGASAGAASIMTPAGAIAALASAGGFITKKIMESTWGLTTAATLLDRKSGILFAEQSMKYGAKQLDKITPSFLMEKSNNRTVGNTSLDAIQRFLGTEVGTSIAERQKALDDLKAKVNLINNNADTADKLAYMAAPLAHTGAPKISQAYINQTLKTFQYLQSILPNADKSINPFKEANTQVSDTQLRNFEKALRIVENPYSILNDLQTGTVSQGQVDTLRSIYPGIYTQVKDRIEKLGGQGELKGMNYATRLKLSLLLGVNFDDSIAQTPSYQSNFMAAKGGNTQTGGAKLNIASPTSNPMMTSIQALQNRK